MPAFMVAVCSCGGLLILSAYYKFIYEPIKNKRSKRRVHQDIHALPPSSNSPFVEVDIRRIQGIHIQEGNNTSNITSPEQSYRQDRKTSVDITSISRKDYRPSSSKSKVLFPPTSVIIN